MQSSATKEKLFRPDEQLQNFFILFPAIERLVNSISRFFCLIPIVCTKELPFKLYNLIQKNTINLVVFHKITKKF